MQALEEAIGTSVHILAVSWSLKKSELCGSVAIRKTVFLRGNKAKRYKYAKDHPN